MSRRLSEVENNRNIRELNNFLAYWRDSPEYPQDNIANDRIQYPVNVVYTWDNEQSKIEFLSKFCAFVGSGPGDGTVDIDDTKKVQIEDFHLKFEPAFQNYTYDPADHSLFISGTSPKMGGKYTVRIRPNIDEP